MRLDVDVWYEDAINDPKLLLPGRGKLQIYLKANVSGICDDGSGGVADVKPCGIVVPPLYTDAVNKVVQITFPDTIWDQPGIPSFKTPFTTSGFNPMDTIALTKTTSLLGISLMDKEGAWPDYTKTPMLACAEGAADKCFPDIDGDGNPGITVKMLTDGTPPDPGFLSGWQYTPAPTIETDALSGDGATEAYTGIRSRLAGGGAINADCKSGTGPADADDFESRVFDCKTKAGAKCSSTQAEFVDKNVPVFHVLKAQAAPPSTWKYSGLNSEIDAKLNRTPSVGPIGAVYRLGEVGQTFTCADVRSAQFPAATK